MKSLLKNNNYKESFYINPDIQYASTLPSSFYISDAWFEESKEKVFAKTWQFCLTEDELIEPGKVLPFDLLPGVLDEPILFVRDQEHVLRCLSNVCTHRGNLLVGAPSVCEKIKCSYHGRSFHLSGQFHHMPEFEQAKNFPTEKDNLSCIPFDRLGNFIFVSLTPSMLFKSCMDEIKKRLFWLPFDKLKLDSTRSRDYLIDAHWALYCENYLEGLHIPFVHKSLRQAIDYKTYTTELYQYANLQLALANENDEFFDLPEDSVDYGKKVSAYYYWIFPNTMLNFYPWGCSVNVVKPLTTRLTKVSFLSYVMDSNKLDRGASSDLDRVEREDEAVVQSVQKGIRSRYYTSGRYSPRMEQGTHHFHRLLSEFLK